MPGLNPVVRQLTGPLELADSEKVENTKTLAIRTIGYALKDDVQPKEFAMIRSRMVWCAQLVLIPTILLAGCGDDDGRTDPTTPATSSDVTTPTSQAPTTTTDEPGVVSPALPSTFSYRVDGWTFQATVTSVPRMEAGKTIDPSQPPGTFALTFRVLGQLSGSVESSDPERDAPVQELSPFLEYKGYSGSALQRAAQQNPTPGCSSHFDITSAGLGREVTLGTDSIDRSDVLYCGGLGSISSDGSSIQAPSGSDPQSPNPGDPLLTEAAVDSVVDYFNQAPPAVYVDLAANDHKPCRFRLAKDRVATVGGPCEPIDADGMPIEEGGADLAKGQVWGGTYLCGTQQGTLQITIGEISGAEPSGITAGTTFHATVRFRLGDQSGSYKIDGVAVDPQKIEMTPVDWIDKSNAADYSMDTFTGTIDKQLMEGNVVGCGTTGFGPDGPFHLSGTN
jgi:hypothetical protein